jgi:amino acid transporter
MSGDLKHPSKAIPKGTLYGLGLTFALYTTVIFVLAASVSRETFYNNTNVIQLVSPYEATRRMTCPIGVVSCRCFLAFNDNLHY